MLCILKQKSGLARQSLALLAGLEAANTDVTRIGEKQAIDQTQKRALARTVIAYQADARFAQVQRQAVEQQPTPATQGDVNEADAKPSVLAIGRSGQHLLSILPLERRWHGNITELCVWTKRSFGYGDAGGMV